MQVIIKTNDPLLVSYVINLLEQEGVKAFEFDQNFSVVDGSIGVIPRRIMVIDEEMEQARSLLKEAGLGHELEPLKKDVKASKSTWFRKSLPVER